MNHDVDRFSNRASERDLIRLVENLWEIECRRLLGSISPLEYRQGIAALRQDLAARADRAMAEGELSAI